MNPVLARETKERFRTRRVSIFVTSWVVGMSAVTYAIYLLAQLFAREAQLGRLVATALIGRFMFHSVTLILVVAVVMVVPGVTALAIVGERERQTLHLLQVSQLTPLQLVLGKLAASISYLLWLMVAILPVLGLPLLFGGASVGDVLAAFGMLVATATLFGSTSIWVSSRARSARGAVAGAYAIAFAIAFLSFVPMTAELIFHAQDQTGPFSRQGGEVYSILLNPFVGMVDAVEAPLELRQDTSSLVTPYAPVDFLLFARQGVAWSFGSVDAVRPGAIRSEDGRQLINLKRPPVWLTVLVFDVVVSSWMLWRAARSVSAPAAKTLELKRNRHAAA